ncbi:MAG: hypothetical protein DMF77_13405 [Acidobacteria bacterium]|nr:MAG: hypothetical protein DMF77_13405 [Acidobacteriota bacterium]
MKSAASTRSSWGGGGRTTSSSTAASRGVSGVTRTSPSCTCGTPSSRARTIRRIGKRRGSASSRSSAAIARCVSRPCAGASSRRRLPPRRNEGRCGRTAAALRSPGRGRLRRQAGDGARAAHFPQGHHVVSVPGPTLLSLTFDDGLDSHLDIVGPALERAGLRATFYVQLAAPPLQRRWKEWQELAARGHELGNHSMLHPAEGRRGWVTAANRIEDYSLERMETELALTNSVLSMIDGQAVRSYAYPCSIDVLGREGWPRRLFTERGLDRRRWGRLILPLLHPRSEPLPSAGAVGRRP